MVVNGRDGRLGVFDPAALEEAEREHGRRHILVHLDTGQELWVPFDLFERRPDGSFALPVSRAQVDFQDRAPAAERPGGPPGQVWVLPVVEEQVEVTTRQTTSGVRVNKRVNTREELVEAPAWIEEVQVERFPRNQVVTEAISPYYEGETLVIPVVEEELVIQKRLVITEEVRITRQRKQVNRQQPVTLRQEEVIVEPIDEAGDRAGESSP